ncbi:tRNA pseudouridine(38-40) synthase TruA [Lachnospiraceae bacterium]|nr:tRNA pseudouridine(38-40) synthase TruA [Lachnospiraceae bacterium]
MKRIMLTVAYDGTGYSGFQAQDNAPTIEGELNRHLGELLEEEIKVIGGSRTDAGVHALCNVAVFDTGARMPGTKISYALNQRLPEDIRVRKSQEVAADFHPRHCESRKTYEYRILNAEFPVPTKRLYEYFTYVPLNADRMKEAAAYLVGEHDFKSFCSAGSQAESTVRTIYSIEVLREGEEIIIRVSGNGFLYNMVRIIAGTLMEAGKGLWEPEHMMEILAAKNRSAAGPTAPACGLMLTNYLFL